MELLKKIDKKDFWSIKDIASLNEFITAHRIYNDVQDGKLTPKFRAAKGKFIFTKTEVEKYFCTYFFNDTPFEPAQIQPVRTPDNLIQKRNLRVLQLKNKG